MMLKSAAFSRNIERASVFEQLRWKKDTYKKSEKQWKVIAAIEVENVESD